MPRCLSPILALLLLTSACDPGPEDTADLATEAETATSAPPPTVTAEPTPTAELEPTAQPTPEPIPTATIEPTAEVAPDFYQAPGGLQVPLPLPDGAPGTVIGNEQLDIGWATGQRIMYHSTAAEGENVAVSGFVVHPNGEVPDGGWPLIAWAHGTTGLGDSCAPSNQAETDQLAQALVGFGYAVVATDYEGLGTPGIHPYVIGPSEAHGVLDSVRAVQELGLPITNEWVVFGHSQGGHAAMFTGQLQPTYAPELDMLGVVAGAPPSQQGDLGNSLVGSDFQGYLVMTAAGLAAAYESLELSDVLSPRAIELIDVIETGCTGEIFEVYNPLDYDTLAVADPFELPEWNERILANDTNQQPVEAPLLIIHGGEDEQIPVETSAALFAQLCAFENQGPTVRNVYDGQTHAGVLTTFAAVPDLLSWVADRFAGETAPDDCP